MDNGGDILQLCRLCLVKDDVNIPIFAEQGDIRQIFLKISSCLPVKVSREDKLPKKICDGCSYKLDMLYEFWNTTANAEKQLLSWLGEAGINAKLADGTISAVAQQIKPVETFVKQEAIDPSDIHTEDDDDKSYMFQQKFSVGEAGPSATVTSNDEPPPKRARRTAAVKAQIAMDPESDDDDDSGEPLTKVEDESEDSDGEDHEPPFVDVPSTSADDQPGPSGVGKDGAEAPLQIIYNSNVIKEGDFTSVLILKEEEIPIEDWIILTQQTEQHWQEPEANEPEERITTRNTKHPPPMEFEPIECGMCTETFKNNVNFALHSIEHSDDQKYHCHLCTFKNVRKHTLEMHVRAHEGATNYKCEICNKAFPISTYAIEHKYFHTGEKPFQCEVCGKSFTYSRVLAAHRTSHRNIPKKVLPAKYECPICNRPYATNSGLRLHKLRKHSKVTVQPQTSSLKSPEANPFVLCDICGKRLVNTKILRLHLRTHTGYKPYGCQACPKTFTQKKHLVDHERVHTGERPFVCKHCGKGFTQRTPLRVHERKIHSSEMLYKCAICEKGYASKGTLDAHTRNCKKKM